MSLLSLQKNLKFQNDDGQAGQCLLDGQCRGEKSRRDGGFPSFALQHREAEIIVPSFSYEAKNMAVADHISPG